MDVRDYELMYIVRPTVADEQFPSVTERVDTMIGALGGEVTLNQPWGKRRLAYPIDKHEDGYYVVSRIKLDSSRTRDLEEQLRIYDDVIRHILVTPVQAPPPRPGAIATPTAPEAQAQTEPEAQAPEEPAQEQEPTTDEEPTSEE